MTPQKTQLLPVMLELVKKISQKAGWQDSFEKAISQAKAWGIREMEHIRNLDDFISWCNALLTWAPSENLQGKEIYNMLCLFYFVFDQPAVKDLQTPIAPNQAPRLTFISSWVVRYADAMGKFLDTPESISTESLKTFTESPNYNINYYTQTRTGFKSFNGLFARNFKPGYRPIAAV